MLCEVFSLCYVRFLDASNPRKRVLARFARCGRFAAAGGPRYIATNPPRGVGTGGTNPPLGTSMTIVSVYHCLTLQFGRFLGFSLLLIQYAKYKEQLQNTYS